LAAGSRPDTVAGIIFLDKKDERGNVTKSREVEKRGGEHEKGF
jgi:hypothetical protein